MQCVDVPSVHISCCLSAIPSRIASYRTDIKQSKCFITNSIKTVFDISELPLTLPKRNARKLNEWEEFVNFSRILGSSSQWIRRKGSFMFCLISVVFTCYMPLSGIPDLRSQMRLSRPWPHLKWRALTWQRRPGDSWGWGPSTRPRVQGGREGRPGNVRDVLGI